MGESGGGEWGVLGVYIFIRPVEGAGDGAGDGGRGRGQGTAATCAVVASSGVNL